MHHKLKKDIIDILLQEKKKEYLCHIKYVVEIALFISKKYKKVDKKIIEIACLLHDIGRDKEIENEEHNHAGKRIAINIFQTLIYLLVRFFYLFMVKLRWLNYYVEFYSAFFNKIRFLFKFLVLFENYRMININVYSNRNNRLSFFSYY